VKTIVSFLFAVLLACQGFCQLVNGSFESNSSLPASLGDWSVVTDWNNAGSADASPDYFHVSANVVTDLPETPSALVNAFDGDAIMGLAVCAKAGANRREYLSTRFSAPLIVGQEYHLCFRITNGIRTSTSLSGLKADNIGVLFSTNAVTQTSHNPINATPHFKIDTALYSEKWEKALFTFIADQPYEYLTLGLFNDDSNHNISIAEGVNPQFAYYFVDDFQLSTEIIDDNPPVDPGTVYTDPPNAPFFVPNAFTPNNDGDNDIFIPVAGTITDWNLEVFTKWGDPVFFSKISSRGWDGSCSGRPCANGSYIWKITYKVADENGESRSVCEYGFVNLVK